MINAQNLLNDLKPLLRKLEDDIRQRCDDVEKMNTGLLSEYNLARSAERTAQTYASWRDDQITQGAVAWILGCVFVRFMEDNGLVEDIGISIRSISRKIPENQTENIFSMYLKKRRRYPG